MENPTLKKTYRNVSSLDQFYSGGPYAVSSNGAFVACACNDEIKIVDASDSSVLSTIEGDSFPITSLTLSPDDKFLFSASHSKQIRVWDVQTLQCVRSWKGHEGPVMSMTCHASGGLLATGGAGGSGRELGGVIKVWDVDSGSCTHQFKGHHGVITSIVFHPDPKQLLLFSACNDGSIRVWNLERKNWSKELDKKHLSAVTSLSISGDGETLISAGRDKVVNVWNTYNYGCQRTIIINEMVETVCCINPDTFIYTHMELCKLVEKKDKAVYFLTVGEHGVISIWSSEKSICIYKQQASSTAHSSDRDDAEKGFTSAAILPSEKGLLCVTGDQQFMFYHPVKSEDGNLKLNLYRRLVGYNEEILDMRFLGDEERYLAVATNLEQVRVYDVASMSCSYVLAGHTEIVVCLDTCVSSSGRTLVASGSRDNTVRVWDVEKRRCVGIAEGHTGAIGAVAFSNKKKNFLISGSCDRTIKVWNIESISDHVDQAIKLKSKATVAAHDKDINSIAVSPKDHFVCSGSEDRTASIWHLPDLVLKVSLKGHKRGIWCVEFSPVEQCVLTSSGDKTIKMWAISDGSCLRTFEGHTSSVLRATFLTLGTQFVSCGGDGLVKLWTVNSNECIATYDRHEEKVWALAVGKKTEMLATGGTDAVINIWHDCTAAEKQEAFEKEQEATIRGQELANAVKDSDYRKAIQLAFELRRPHQLFELFSQLCTKNAPDDSVQNALSGVSKEELRVLFEYIREWNTKPKLCHVAQLVLSCLFKIFSPTDIMEVKGISELLEGLIPYSQRHFTRVDRLVRSTYLLDFVLVGMSVLDPDSNTLSTKPESLATSVDMVEAKSNGHTSVVPTKDCNTDEVENKSSLKKRKSDKSKRSKAKKIKSES